MIQNLRSDNRLLKKRKVPLDKRVEIKVQINQKNANKQVANIGHGQSVLQIKQLARLTARLKTST